MPKFILHGGVTREKNELNAGFVREIIRDLEDGSRILFVNFARPNDEYEKIFERDKKMFEEQVQDRKFEYILASENNLIDEAKRADAIYICGGDIDKLLGVLRKHPEFIDIAKGKVAAGSSAGAYALSMYYYSGSKGGIYEGLGIVPVRIICHYGSREYPDKKDPVDMMKNFPGDLKLVVLKDFEWKVFN